MRAMRVANCELREERPRDGSLRSGQALSASTATTSRSSHLAARIAFGIVLALPASISAQPRPVQPLFGSDSVLELRIEADLKAVFKERGDEGKPYPATVTVGGVAVPAQLGTRGFFRLKRTTCLFPPLRLRFAKEAPPELAGTVFAGQRKLKMVTHCQARDGYEENVIEEYLLYRAYNTLTDTSFRARLARVTYVDSRDGGAKPVTRYAFLIEDEDRMAERLGGKILDQKGATPADLHPQLVVLLSMFAYMVGNTDWGLGSLHNIRLVQTSTGYILPVPYDFDWSAVVDAPYAAPAAQFGTKTIYERVYMGPCVPPPEMEHAVALFTSRRDSIYALFRNESLLDRRAGERAVRYLDDFFGLLKDDRARRRTFSQGC